jgi:hypothetical protein
LQKILLKTFLKKLALIEMQLCGGNLGHIGARDVLLVNLYTFISSLEKNILGKSNTI